MRYTSNKIKVHESNNKIISLGGWCKVAEEQRQFVKSLLMSHLTSFHTYAVVPILQGFAFICNQSNTGMKKRTNLMLIKS